jgi:hypothetical protein
VGHVQVVEQSPPRRIVVEDRVGEADNGIVTVGDDRALTRLLPREPIGPHRQPVGDHVAVEEGVGVRAPVVASPALGVQLSNGVDVSGRRRSVAHCPPPAPARFGVGHGPDL